MTRYRTLVIDPPWQYTKAPNTDRGKSRSAEAKYGTLTNAEIAALPVGDLAAESAHLYMWVTNPRLYRGRSNDGVSPIDLVEGWGFTYQTLLTWVKTGAPGMGWYFRGDTEHILFATRGEDAGIPPEKRISNVFTAPRSRHSAKPDMFLDLVEQVSPGPYVELFARSARFGWDYWGDQSLGTATLGTEAA